MKPFFTTDKAVLKQFARSIPLSAKGISK
jgi:hypothetical protein